MLYWQCLSLSLRERTLLAKNNRKLEKKYKEAMLQVEEERRHADQYKEQVGLHVHYSVMRFLFLCFSKTYRIHPEFGIVQKSGFLGIRPFNAVLRNF